VERAGNFQTGGSITAFYTVLVEGDDFNEPVTDNLRAILDGHIVLSRSIANQGILPAVAVLESVSRLQNSLVEAQHKQLIREIIRLFSVYEESKDMIDLGVYEPGRNLDLDKALDVVPQVRKLISQAAEEVIDRNDLLLQLAGLLNRSPAQKRRGHSDPAPHSARRATRG
jgi:flagellum-specific ATP synthase